MTLPASRGPRQRRRPGGPLRWRAADKTAHLAAFAARGGTIAAYCAAAGVPRATFTLWQREARDARGTARPGRRRGPTFARVEVVAPPLVPALTLVVRRGTGVAAEVTGLDAPTLTAVLSALFRAVPRGGRVIGLAIYLATGVTDLRRGVTGLYTLILEQLAQEPLSGAVFGFCNRRRDCVTLCMPPLESW